MTVFTSNGAKDAHVEGEEEGHDDLIVRNIVSKTCHSAPSKIPEVTISHEPNNGRG